MNRSFVLRNARACKINACLEGLVEMARKRTGPNRPPSSTLQVMPTDESMLHVSVNLAPNQAVWSIYAELPSYAQRHGRRLLGVTTLLDPQCQARSGNQCIGKCGSEFEIHISQQADFPLTVDEVNWFILHYFGMGDLARYFTPHDQLYLKDVSDHLRAEHHPTEFVTVNRRRPGAPRLQVNIRLFDEMSALPDPYDNKHLCEGWKQGYLAERGVLPINADKRFRQIAHIYAEQIHHERLRLKDADGPLACIE